MQVTSTDLHATFRAETDTTLIDLAATASSMTPESRQVLLLELEARLRAAENSGETVRKVGGWYTVAVPRTSVRFPNLCPRCLRSGAEELVTLESNIEKKRLFKEEVIGKESIDVPHCQNCARAVRSSRRVAGILTAIVAAVVLILMVFFELPGLLFYLIWIPLALPAMVLYTWAPTVMFGDCTTDRLELRFKKPEYATTFAALNNVAAQNRDTLRDELALALAAVRSAGAA